MDGPELLPLMVICPNLAFAALAEDFLSPFWIFLRAGVGGGKLR
jgi:hypothetical protein